MRCKNTEKPVYMEQYARVAAVLNVGQGEVEGNIFRRPFVFEHQNGFAYLLCQIERLRFGQRLLVFQFGKMENVAGQNRQFVRVRYDRYQINIPFLSLSERNGRRRKRAIRVFRAARPAERNSCRKRTTHTSNSCLRNVTTAKR